jgi:hypothetical protein
MDFVPSTGPKGRVRQSVEAILQDVDTMSIPQVTDRVVRQVQQDDEWTRQLLSDALKPLIYEIVRRTVQNTRGLVVYGSEIVSRERFEERVRERASRFASWLEHCGESHVRIMTANRVQLRAAALERRTSAETDLTLAALWEALARKLPDDTSTVESTFTPDQIAEMEAAIRARQTVSAGVEALVHHASAVIADQPE